jgi:hypothetical protein
MKPYKSLFRESRVNPKIYIPVDQDSGRQRVDISNLIFDQEVSKSNWDDAEQNCPIGKRLPTIQELYSFSLTGGLDDKPNGYYWSSSPVDEPNLSYNNPLQNALNAFEFWIINKNSNIVYTDREKFCNAIWVTEV